MEYLKKKNLSKHKESNRSDSKKNKEAHAINTRSLIILEVNVQGSSTKAKEEKKGEKLLRLLGTTHPNSR